MSSPTIVAVPGVSGLMPCDPLRTGTLPALLTRRVHELAHVGRCNAHGSVRVATVRVASEVVHSGGDRCGAKWWARPAGEQDTASGDGLAVTVFHWGSTRLQLGRWQRCPMAAHSGIRIGARASLLEAQSVNPAGARPVWSTPRVVVPTVDHVRLAERRRLPVGSTL